MYVYKLKQTVPLEFAKKYFNIEKNTIGKNAMLVKLQRIDGKSWSVKCKSRLSDRKPRLEFHHGWKQFAVDNDLRIGDVCVFELIHRIELIFDVTIFRDTNGGTQSIYSAQGSKVDLQESNRKQDIQRKNVCASKVKSANPKSCDQFRSQFKFGGICNQRAKPALEKAENFESNNPFFRVCIRPCHVHRSQPLVPTTFYLWCTTEREKNILIQVGEISWHAKLIYYPHLSSAYFSAGWPAFARENDLRGGDVCIFELINREVLKAHIFRSTVRLCAAWSFCIFRILHLWM
ncbi:hypothetical protein L6164_001299 [Bauhinia variegata]|uniref:Uncharacterized protein n=1 Tax=Bauhinia variegata TaxID=167791 RepID=A0ACB9Q9B2_BAUVA|nr:hypothetical protein L6164_001299 [Bauhinia variegata]